MSGARWGFPPGLSVMLINRKDSVCIDLGRKPMDLLPFGVQEPARRDGFETMDKFIAGNEIF